eukprot:1136765-Pelagomonas_calceolata.AAC.2
MEISTYFLFGFSSAFALLFVTHSRTLICCVGRCLPAAAFPTFPTSTHYTHTPHMYAHAQEDLTCSMSACSSAAARAAMRWRSVSRADAVMRPCSSASARRRRSASSCKCACPNTRRFTLSVQSTEQMR